MLIVSQNLSNYQIPIPENSIYRIYLAWINNLNEFRNTYYVPNNTTLLICGNFNISKVKKKVKNLLNNIKYKKIPKIKKYNNIQKKIKYCLKKTKNDQIYII